MKSWFKKSVAVAASAALMVPVASAFAEETPQQSAKNVLASNSQHAGKNLTNEDKWMSKDTIIIKHSGLDKNVHKKSDLRSSAPFLH